MVLLTSSAISVVISSGVVCLFTFLLFLSGYVLQQQTVRSLQQALAAPVEVRVRVQPTLPPQFQDLGDVLEVAENGNETSITIDAGDIVTASNDPSQQILDETPSEQTSPASDAISEPTAQDLWHAYVDNLSPQTPQITPPQDTRSPTDYAYSGKFAYALTIPNPSDLCSALAFTLTHRTRSTLSPAQANIVIIYPSDWENSPSPTHRDALALLLRSEHAHSVLLHPVPISKVWTGIDVESQLLSELARNPWPYDRVMYVRTPGLLVDVDGLDRTMTGTYADPGRLKRDWTRLRAPRGKRAGLGNVHPDVLMFAQGRGLMVPVGELEGKLTGRASTRRVEAGDEGSTGEGLSREAAYVLFDEEELSQREKDDPHDDVFARFEEERATVCEGTVLLQ